jgi:type I restriction enzyme S subunit
MLNMEAIKNFSIDKSDWQKVKFGDVVFEPKESVKNPVEEGVEHVVGLEHIDKEDIHLRRSAGIEESTTFTKKFSEGDVLFGRRRAYLKKAAQATFEGVCSGDITVMRAREELLLPALLPFIVNNDKFFDFAITHSAGGLSPRVKFKDLAKFEFYIPRKEQQAELTSLFKSINEIAEKERELLEKADSVIFAKRREYNSGELKVFKGADITDLITKGASPKWQGFEYTNSGMVFVTSENVLSGKMGLNEKKYLPLEFHEKQKRSQLRKDDVLINIVGASIGRVAVFNEDIEAANINQAVCLFRTKMTLALPEYIVDYLLEGTNLTRLLNNQSATARPNLSLKDLSEFEFHLPSLELQKQRNLKMIELKLIRDNISSKKNSSKKLFNSLVNKVF